MISPELQKIYAGSEANRVLETVQLQHAQFAQDYYFVNDVEQWRFTVSDVPPSFLQEFTPMPFQILLPEKNTTGRQELQINLCNIGRELVDEIEATLLTPDAILLTYRLYLDIADSQEQNNPPLKLNINAIALDNYSVTATATRFDVLNQGFPTRLYTLDEFPGLRR